MILRKKGLPDLPGVETTQLNAREVRRGLRVRIVDRDSDHFGNLGTVSSVREGCSCSDGWCRVLLDSGQREEFRYGYRGDVSDLLAITKEPEREPIPFLTRSTAQVNATVKVWAGSENYYRDADRGDGKITAVEGGWVTVQFKDEYSNEYPFDEEDLILVALAKAETEAEKKARLQAETEATKKGIGKLVTPLTAKIGARVKLSRKSQYSDQSRAIGTITNDDDPGWKRVRFDDGYSNVYRYGLSRVDGGTSDLILVQPAP